MLSLVFESHRQVAVSAADEEGGPSILLRTARSTVRRQVILVEAAVGHHLLPVRCPVPSPLGELSSLGRSGSFSSIHLVLCGSRGHPEWAGAEPASSLFSDIDKCFFINSLFDPWF